MVRWCGGAVVRWCVVRWCGGAVVRWCARVCVCREGARSGVRSGERRKVRRTSAKESAEEGAGRTGKCAGVAQKDPDGGPGTQVGVDE